MEDLHTVAGRIDKDKHVSLAQVHPHPVRDFAAQAVEPQVHVYVTVVEPVPVAGIKAEHCSLISVLEDGRMSYFPGCASLCRRLYEVLLSGSFPLSVRHPSGTSSCSSALKAAGQDRKAAWPIG